MLPSCPVYLEMSSDFEDYDKPPAPPVRLTSTKYAFVVYWRLLINCYQ